MRKAIALMAVGGLLTWLGLCLSAAIDIVRAARKDWEASGGGCAPGCACKCGQPTCGCHVRPRPKPTGHRIGVTPGGV
jgi:hypothetical protein